MNLPKYKCHTVIQAAEVEAIIDGSVLRLAGVSAPIAVGADWIATQGVRVGGYYARSQDGVPMFLSPDALLDNYSLISGDIDTDVVGRGRSFWQADSHEQFGNPPEFGNPPVGG